MAHVVVIGAQWGDEGKGKIVDWLSERADIVVRFQGGHNAGHTLVIDGTIYKLSLLPSGIVRSGKVAMIGNGVVIDPQALCDEIETLRGQGVAITPDNLKIAPNAALILPLHQALDMAHENANESVKIGTTQRGIGPAYEDKVARRALRAADLADPDTLPEKIAHLLRHHNALRRGWNLPEYKPAEVLSPLAALAGEIVPYIAPVWRLLDAAHRRGDAILFEGAQGALLDVDHGTYPFVTASNTLAGQAAIGSGVSPTALGCVLGIAKAYTTRVGEGPFPTELDDDTGRKLGERGREFGTVTGRTRRCGWFDAVAVRQMARTAGVDAVALTKLDVLDGFEEVKICTAYRLDGAEIDVLPALAAEQARLEPVYETLKGWPETSSGLRDSDALPPRATAYIRRIEELIETPITLLSTGADREDTICLEDPFGG